jgi:hypothetical protein
MGLSISCFTIFQSLAREILPFPWLGESRDIKSLSILDDLFILLPRLFHHPPATLLLVHMSSRRNKPPPPLFA